MRAIGRICRDDNSAGFSIDLESEKIESAPAPASPTRLTGDTATRQGAASRASPDSLRTEYAPSHRRQRAGRGLGKVALLVVFAVVVGAGWIRWTATRQVYHDSADKIVTVDPGSGTHTVLGRLADAGIVRHPIALRLYLLVTRQGTQLKAGDYKFASPISPLQALEKIHRGEVYYERITIPEGFNRFEIAEVLAAKTGKATPEEFLQLMNDTSLVAGIAPEAGNLEGYLFPDTYIWTTRTTTEDLIRAMVRRFQEVFTPEMAIRARRLGMSVNQVVTLASIIEKEAKAPEDRSLIASVLRNRLGRGMPLAADPTFIYAALLAGDYDGNPNQPRHRKRESPYNTYIHEGLPPGPIASPGRASIEAALYPADTDYLYYVLATPDGRHKFSRTVAEHEAAVAQYHLLRQQQQNQNGGR